MVCCKLLFIVSILVVNHSFTICLIETCVTYVIYLLYCTAQILFIALSNQVKFVWPILKQFIVLLRFMQWCLVPSLCVFHDFIKFNFPCLKPFLLSHVLHFVIWSYSYHYLRCVRSFIIWVLNLNLLISFLL